MEFEPEFINDKLILFDLMNSLHCLINNRIRNIEKDSNSIIDPTLNLSPTLLQLDNPKCPNFAPLLKDNGFIDDNIDKSAQTISDYILLIFANIRLFKNEKLSLDAVRNKNRTICEMIVRTAEQYRRQNSSKIPSTTTFQFLVRSNPMLNGIVLVQKVFNDCIIYIPASGFLRKIQISESTPPIDFQFSYQKTECHLPSHSSIFDNKLVEYLIYLISSDPKFPPKINSFEDFLPTFNLTSKLLFPNQFQETDNWDLKCYSHDTGYFFIF